MNTIIDSVKLAKKNAIKSAALVTHITILVIVYSLPILLSRSYFRSFYYSFALSHHVYCYVINKSIGHFIILCETAQIRFCDLLRKYCSIASPILCYLIYHVFPHICNNARSLSMILFVDCEIHTVSQELIVVIQQY
jgi:hypothetical protein